MIAAPCPHCSAWNMPGSNFCDSCGMPMQDGQFPLGAPRIITIGRDEDNTYVVRKGTVSGHHAQLEVTGDGRLLLRDLKSMNQTYVNMPVEPITYTEVQPGDTVYLGRMAIPVYELLAHQQTASRVPQRKPDAMQIQMRSPRIVFGRDPKADQTLDHPMVSWHHAILTRSQDNRYFIEDLNSRNGTWVNGKRLQPGRRVEITVDRDEISFGSYSFKLNAVGTIEARETGREIRVIATGIGVSVPDESGGVKRILEEASLAIEPGDLVALMGPSGAGKSTLLCALNGINALSEGQVTYQRGASQPMDLRRNYAQIRPLIGYVPQDDIMHPQLTVFEALYYTARLRLPQDFSDAQIHLRIQKVLSSIGLWEEYDPAQPGRRLLQYTIIGDAVRRGVSGGQRKRVNLAMELLSEPALLFLDEPTSGLSAVDSETVVRTLKELADGGCTIIVTIHQPSLEVYQLFTLLAMVSNHPRTKGGNKEIGHLVYFGPAMKAFDFFGCQSKNGGGQPGPKELESTLLSRPVSDWVSKYESYGLAEHYGSVRTHPKSAAGAELPPIKRDHFAQLRTLTERYLKLKGRDHTQMALAIGLPIVFGALVAASQRLGDLPANRVFDDVKSWTVFIRKVGTLQFLMVVAAFWFGCNNAIREVVGERAVYRRERMVNLSIFAYIGSKYVVLGLLALVQCAIMLGIAQFAHIRADYLQLLATLWITAIAGTGLGLSLSAALPTSEAAIASLPLVLLPMIVLGGGMSPLHEMRDDSSFLRNLADVAIPTRWAYEANMLKESAAQNVKGTTPDLMVQKEIEKRQTQQAAAQPPQPAAARTEASTAAEPAQPPDAAENAFPIKERHSYAEALTRLGIFAALLALLAAVVLKVGELSAWKTFTGRIGHGWKQLGVPGQLAVIGLAVAALVVIALIS